MSDDINTNTPTVHITITTTAPGEAEGSSTSGLVGSGARPTYEIHSDDWEVVHAWRDPDDDTFGITKEDSEHTLWLGRDQIPGVIEALAKLAGEGA